MKTIKFSLISAILAYSLVSAGSHALALTGDAGSDSSQDAATTVVTPVDTSSVINSNPSTDAAQDAPAVVSPTPIPEDTTASVNANTSTGASQDTKSSVTSNPSTEADQDTSPGANGNNPTTPDDNNPGGGSPAPAGGNGGGGGGGGSFGSGGGNALLASVGGTVTQPSSCPLITTFMKLGYSKNNGIEVTKLQVFLKNHEGANVDATGIFDQKTKTAVENFQRKYLSLIMGPWDATRPSGIVHITTMKKINELACMKPLTLNASELATIEAYKKALNENANGQVVADNGSSTPGIDEAVATVTPDQATGTDNGDNTASVGNASILARFWQFILNLFR